MNIYIYFVVIIYLYNYYNSDYYYNYLSQLFNKLNKKSVRKCKNTKNLKCIDNNRISYAKNMFVFLSKKFVVKKVISPFYFINSSKFISGNKNKKVKHHFTLLKTFGFKNVVLSIEGSIHSKCWNITTNGGCKCSYIPPIIFNNSRYRRYDKVVSISHHWCNAVYHSICECMGKLGYFIPDLLKDTSIKIHTMRSASINYLHLLGFNDSRLIYGNVYVNKLLVLEKGKCGYPPPLIHLHSLRYYLRIKIKSKKKYDIVIIKRYGKRDIVNFNEVYLAVKTIYKEENIVIFYPNTTFDNTLNYFKHAKLIVAPHGAGLTNMIISNSNCKIIEFYYINACYFSLASNLGLEYYAIYENLKNRMFNINISRFVNVIKHIKI